MAAQFTVVQTLPVKEPAHETVGKRLPKYRNLAVLPQLSVLVDLQKRVRRLVGTMLGFLVGSLVVLVVPRSWHDELFSRVGSLVSWLVGSFGGLESNAIQGGGYAFYRGGGGSFSSDLLRSRTSLRKEVRFCHE